MVDLNLDDETRMIVKAVADFVDAEVVPVQEKLRDTLITERRLLKDDGTLVDEVIEASRELRRRSGKQGFYGMHMPEEVGGGGVSKVGMLHAFKEVYTRGPGLTYSVLASVEGPSKLLLALDEDKREEYLAPLMRGERTTCFALTEPQAGSDVRNLRTTAVKDGDEYVLNGTKTFVTNGPYCDFAQVFAKTDPDSDGYDAITAFIVDKGTPGFQATGTQDTISSDGLQCEFVFDDCRVPAENVIGGEGEGFFHAMANIADARNEIGGRSIGLAKYCLDQTLPYVRERKAFGRPITKFQGVSFPLADAYTQMRAAEQLALWTAWNIDQGDEGMLGTSMTKLYATEMLWQVADACVQACGGMGVTKEMGLEAVLRMARVQRIYEGTSEIQRATIAKEMGL